MDAQGARVVIALIVFASLLVVLAIAVIWSTSRARDRTADKEAREGWRAFLTEQVTRIERAILSESKARAAAETERLHMPRITRLSE